MCQIRDYIEFALYHSRRLKSSRDYASVYLSPYRSKEQRLEHGLLVKQLTGLPRIHQHIISSDIIRCVLLINLTRRFLRVYMLHSSFTCVKILY